MLISRIHTSGCRESVNLNLLSYFIKKEDKEHYNLIYLKEILETKLCFAQKKKKKESYRKQSAAHNCSEESNQASLLYRRITLQSWKEFKFWLNKR